MSNQQPPRGAPAGSSREQALEQVLLQAIDAVVTIDASNRVTFFNPAAERLWGYSADEVIGQNVKMLVPPQMQHQHDAMIDANRTTGRNRIVGTSREVPVHRKDGTMAWGSLSLSKVTIGETVCYTAFVRDITEEHRVREGLKNEAASVMRAVAAGDLRFRIQGDYGEDMAELIDAINDCAASLTQMINEIRPAADEIETNAGEVASGNQRLRARTEEQACSLEQTSANMEEITRTVTSSAENIEQVAALSGQAREVAHSGHDQVRRAVAAMADIAQASQQVNDIIGVIDEIAFQTNLLALNAAVEAARAGEQGRGFAVVASEVRNLAQRSATAAKEIKQLIGSNMERVSVGTRLVNDSGTTLDEIVQAVSRVSEITTEIARGSREQSEGIAQINRAVTHMDQITQETAAVADGAATASDALSARARQLQELVSHFRTGSPGDREGSSAATPHGAPHDRRRPRAAHEAA